MNMTVAVLVDLTAEAKPEHCATMRDSAMSLTDDPQSVRVTIEETKFAVLAKFTMPKSRQIDITDKILHKFSLQMNDYETCTIWFPRTPKRTKAISTPSGNALEFTVKQGQFLAFIHSYSVIQGRSPAERDMQDFFGTAPPTIHQMILKLEANGWISRVPGQARSIRLLVPPGKLPVLQPRICDW